ncbi:MAG TPA: DUF6519 domain-containing protein [Bryobacteraceae bacterium]|nr:DUF6519 domain-containing protein [Bryobacteraceae bacterium]
MPGDFSRDTFNPGNRFSGVLMQQGRVQLDADWNEQVRIQHHRMETESIDVIGRCGTPEEGGGFVISQSPRGSDLLIAPGRFYVDGLLCELGSTPISATFPASATDRVTVGQATVDGRDFAPGQWVAIWAEQNPLEQYFRVTAFEKGTHTLTLDASIAAYRNAGLTWLRLVASYASQPDYPNPEFAGSSPIGSEPNGTGLALPDGAYLVYLRAFEREVNALEHRLLREVALGGPDTTERLQTVFQVRLLPVFAAASPLASPPSSPPASPPSSPPESPPSSPPECCVEETYTVWDHLVAPPTGRMNARTMPPAPGDNPCVLPPTAGYQRLENQLYRVEILRSGDTAVPGNQPTFVWSRDNGTVESSVTKVDVNDVYLADLGRDAVLGFAAGQWVELINTEDELSGTPRMLAEITKPLDNDIRKVTLSSSAAAFAKRANLRLRRWDVTGPTVTATGIPVTTGWVELESGVQIQFRAGTYVAGSYWLIPARTATGEIEWPPYDIPNSSPIPQPPRGPTYHYCRLARINVFAGVWHVEDMRRTFPSLTCISAEDVCYESQCCDFDGVRTVQQALDTLCSTNDLRFHKKTMHGWGIACGMQVVCGPNPPSQKRRHVTVRKGYAVDSNGNDIILRQDQTLDVIAMLTSPSTNSGLKDGEYCLILDRAAPGGFRLVPYDPDWKSIQSLLSGTLLMDFFTDCIKSLSDFFNDQFTAKPGEAKLPVGPTQKRLTALTNLAIQFVAPDVGSYVYLSGDKNAPISEHEDTILRTFYDELRKRLQSATYCGMFDGARQFPPYPYSNLDVPTIFGKNFKTRLRVDPTGARGYTLGVNNVINVFDLKKRQMVSELPFPAGSGAVVQDVAFSPDGAQLYAVANLNNRDTVFATADVKGLQHTWQSQTTVVCNVVLTTLMGRPSDASTVFAIGVGKGLYAFDPKKVNATPDPLYPLKAFGHLVIDDAKAFAYVTSNNTAATDQFNEVHALNLTKGVQSDSLIALNGLVGKAGDDIALVPQSQFGPTQLFVTGILPGGSNKQLLRFPTDIGNVPPGAPQPIDLEENTTVRLAHNPVTNFLAISFEDSYRIKLFSPANKALETSRHPVQIQPVSLVFSERGNTAYVLNWGSNTITAMPAAYLNPRNQPDLQALVNYRSGVINAFLDLAGGFLQYLKDCFCDHLITKCPSDCDEETARDLFLACLTVKEGQVEKVCNFEKRKELHTIPKLEYWLSLVPIMPLIGRLFERICCSVLPSFFGRKSAPQAAPAVANNPSTGFYTKRFTGEKARSSVEFAQRTNFKQAAGRMVSHTLKSGQFFAEAVSTPSTNALTQPQIGRSEIEGRHVDDARAKLEAAHVTVERVVKYDPAKAGENALRFNIAPANLAPGSSVTLVADEQGTVRYFVPAAPEVAELRTEVRTTKEQVAQAADSVNHALAASQEAKAEFLQTRERVDQHQAAINQAIGTNEQLKVQLDSAQKALADTQQRLAENVLTVEHVSSTTEQLRSLIEASQKSIAAIQPTLTSATGLQDEVNSLRQQMTNLQTANQQELAKRDQQIGELSTQFQGVAELRALVTRISKVVPLPD